MWLTLLLMSAAAAVSEAAMPQRLPADCVDPRLATQSGITAFPSGFQTILNTPSESSTDTQVRLGDDGLMQRRLLCSSGF